MRITIRAAAIVLVTQGASCFFWGMMLAARQKTRSMAPVKKTAGKKSTAAKKTGTTKTARKKSATKKTTKKKVATQKTAAKKNKLGVKNSLVNNINAKKKKGTSRPRKKSTVSRKSYAQMKENWGGEK